jgi:uncharacterized pyridoxamine 5'-phosphate oxidase family protein
MATAKPWQAFAEAAPDLATTGTRLLYQNGEVASALLATVAPDGGPRVHPVFPVLAMDELWLFIVNLSPKYRDLKRNGRFALHSVPQADAHEEFHLRGSAEEIGDVDVRRRVVDATHGRQGGADFEALFRCGLQSALYTRWEGWGTADIRPTYQKWFA